VFHSNLIQTTKYQLFQCTLHLSKLIVTNSVSELQSCESEWFITRMFSGLILRCQMFWERRYPESSHIGRFRYQFLRHRKNHAPSKRAIGIHHSEDSMYVKAWANDIMKAEPLEILNSPSWMITGCEIVFRFINHDCSLISDQFFEAWNDAWNKKWTEFWMSLMVFQKLMIWISR
jgi:hypothetical protein